MYHRGKGGTKKTPRTPKPRTCFLSGKSVQPCSGPLCVRMWPLPLNGLSVACEFHLKERGIKKCTTGVAPGSKPKEEMWIYQSLGAKA